MPERIPSAETQLEDALLEAFNLESLNRMVRRSLGMVLEHEVGLNRGLKYIVADLVALSVREGWRDELLRGAITDNPNPWLKAIAAQLKIPQPSTVPEPRKRDLGQLEKIVRERGVFLKWKDFTQRLSELGRQLCRIEIPTGKAIGTGWLVGPDLVLTNYHVIEDVDLQRAAREDVVFRFDYFVDAESNPGGVTCGLSDKWRVDVSRYATSDTRSDAPEPTEDELDYALVRLARPVGNEVVDGINRGWVRVSATPPVVVSDDILLVPQHPDGRSLEVAFGKALEFNTSGTRLRHDVNTEGGSSGSPCFTVSLSPFGLHHASGPGRALRYNQCVPLRHIIQRARRSGVAPFWEDASLESTGGPSLGEESVELQSKRPERRPIENSSPSLFKGLAGHGGELRPMRSHLLSWEGTDYPECCFIVGPNGEDLEATLLDVDDALAIRSREEQPSKTTIWIRSDELLSQLESSSIRSPKEQLSIMFRQVWPHTAAYSQDALEKLLKRVKYNFLIDFSGVRLNDLISVQADEPRPELTFVPQILKTFIDFVVRKGHFVAVGLPKFLFALEAWRKLAEVTTISLFTADLFVPFHSGDALLDSVAIPDVIRQVLSPLASSNSHSLRKVAINLARQAEKRNLVSSGRRRQLAEVLTIAGKLEREDFIEPAYRLEVYYRRNLDPDGASAGTADLYSLITSEQAGVVGFLEGASDLPRVTNAALITGESGIGKTTALQQIETSWCLPRPIEPGRSGPCWMPLYLDSVDDLKTDIRASFRRNSSASSFEPQAVRLSAHQRLSQLATKASLSWIFSSPVLYLVDNLGIHTADSESTGWVERSGAVVEQKIGLIIGCRHRSEAPDWFAGIFPDAVEARLRHVDLPSARNMCSTAEQLEYVQRLFSSPCEPLNQYVHNRFLLSCILDSNESVHLDESSGLVDLLDVYTKARLSDFDMIFANGLLEEQFPNLAACLARGESPALAREVKNVGISQNLLARGEAVRFAHPFLFEYFLAKYIARNWTDDPGPLFDSLLGAKRKLWGIRYLNLFRMLMKELDPNFRATLAELLAKVDVNMAHRCLLELSPSEYSSVTQSSEIRDSLVRLILFQAPEGEHFAEREFATKIQAAESLAWYDPRFQRSEKEIRNFIELRVNEVPACAAGRYPVTNLEYSEFVRAGGYDSEEFWLPTAWAWRSRNKITEPAMWFVEEFNRANTPVVGVSFYEALAYARWFGKGGSLGSPESISDTFSLPTDREWAVAAGLTRGFHEGVEAESLSVFVPTEQMTALQTERNLRATLQDNTNAGLRHGNLPVGLLPCGPCVVSDLLGNVWEWCDEWFGSPNFSSAPPSQTDLSVPFPVMVRGGPATNAGSAVISLVGSGMDPFSRVFNVGFRLFQRR